MKISLNSDLLALRNALEPYTKRAYFVGGCVRDAILGRDLYDYDVEVYGIAPDKFDTLMQSLGADGVGKSYFIYKFKNIDVGLARSETKIGKGHADFSVSYEDDPRLASMRRDFSINAMMIDIFTGELLDFWGGMRDIKSRTIRHIDDKKFAEDSLRVLRAVQFAARLGFKIAPKTLRLMRRLSINNLSKSRINSELIKLFNAENIEIGIRYIFALNLFEAIFGFTPKKSDLKRFVCLIKEARLEIKDEGLFLYLLCGFFDLNLSKLADTLGLGRRFAKLRNQPYFSGEVSDEMLANIAIDMPLKEWLGCWGNRRKRALKLGIFDNAINFSVKPDDIAGLSGASIANRVKELKSERAKQYLALSANLIK